MCLYLWKITQGAATALTQFIFPLLSVEGKEMLYLEVDLHLRHTHEVWILISSIEIKMGNSGDFQNEAQNTLEAI